jgi:hypothetical protein
VSEETLRLSRRSVALGAVALVLGCQKRSLASSSTFTSATSASALRATPVPPGDRGSTRLVEWQFDGAVSSRTALLVPTWGAADARFPVLVALHGRGEARKSPTEGALGWPRDYALAHAIERVSAPPLTPVDFESFVDAARLAHLNHALGLHSFQGLIVACPYVPDLDLADDDAIAAFGRFVTDVLLPRVRTELPARAEAAATGIDGVSLGGAVALAVGLDSARSFGAVGTLQPAIDVHDAARWAARAQAARRANPSLAIRLLTSDGDYFRDAVRATSAAFDAAGIIHDFDQVLGPHDYPFNRGPGGIEMLMWHDRELRRRH